MTILHVAGNGQKLTTDQVETIAAALEADPAAGAADAVQLLRFMSEVWANDQLLAEVNALDHVGLAKLWRFAQCGDPRLQNVVGERVRERLFTEFGGFTPAISKSIGWDR